jgi:predicted GTPase
VADAGQCVSDARLQGQWQCRIAIIWQGAANEPILILKNGRPETVLLSYDQFVRRRGRQAYSIDDLPPHLVAAILEAKVPDELEEAKL